MEGEYHVHCWAFCSEATLGLGVDSLSYLLEAHKHDSGVKFAYNAQERDAPVVVTVTSVQSDNLSMSHVLRYGFFSPALTKDVMQRLQEGVFAALDQIRWDAIIDRCFAAGQTINRLAEIFQCWFAIQLLHDGKEIDGVKGWSDNYVLSGVQLWVVLYPSLHLLAFVGDHSPAGRFEGECFALTWALLIPSYIPLMLPVTAAVWMSLLSCWQYLLAHIHDVCCTLLPAALSAFRDFWLGEHVY